MRPFASDRARSRSYGWLTGRTDRRSQLLSALLLRLDLAQLLQTLAFHRLAPLITNGRRLLEVLPPFPFANDPLLLDDPLESLQRLLEKFLFTDLYERYGPYPPSAGYRRTAPAQTRSLTMVAPGPVLSNRCNPPLLSSAQIEHNHMQTTLAVSVTRFQPVDDVHDVAWGDLPTYRGTRAPVQRRPAICPGVQ